MRGRFRFLSLPLAFVPGTASLCLLSAAALAAAGGPPDAVDIDRDLVAGPSAADPPAELDTIAPIAYGVPGATPGVPADAELEAAGAVVGEIIIDNQNIFDLRDPRDDTKLFRLANRLHPRTRAYIVRRQLLFRSGDRYSRRLLDETERLLRADRYFYDAWIRPTRYHDGKVDLRVTTRDVWTLNPGFNFGRSGGSNSTGVQIEELNVAGSGTSLKLSHSKDVDRSSSQIEFGDMNAFGTWTNIDLNYADLSDGRKRDITINRPFYALDTRWAAGIAGQDDLQSDSLYDRGKVIDQFQDKHEAAEISGGLSRGLQNGWVRRWSAGVTYDEHLFTPLSTWTGATTLPLDRRFVFPWVQFDLVQDDYLRLFNHDQIGRTEDFYLGTTASLRLGYASKSLGSSRSATMIQSAAGRGFRKGRSTLLLNGTFTGRVEAAHLTNGLLSGGARYYVEQSSHWLFYTTLQGTKGWRLDLEDQVLLGGDNGLRGYPLRYQGGTSRALLTVEQRYFTDWYPFRLFRVGAAVFADTGRTWGTAPLGGPGLGQLTDAGFGLRFGNSRSGLGNVVHVDLAFPFNGDPSIKRVQFLVQTEQRF
jgi:outer membrane protein assembly factor BamA